jgi:integrase
MLEVSAIANKGTGFVSIPAHWTVVEIYESSWPYKISLKTYNEQVKVIGRLAGLNQPVLLEKYKGGKNYKETKLFYELMASHTCRRSFCSNLLIAGLPIQTIMAFSGHSTEKSFNIYTAYVTTEIRTAKASEHAIWKKPKQEPINNKEFSGVNE